VQQPANERGGRLRQQLRRSNRLRSAYYFVIAVGRAIADSRGAARSEFDRCYATGHDPWSYGSNPEARERYPLAVGLLDEWRAGERPRALEIGCGEGLFTELLADRCEAVLAVDLSEAALERARGRCADRENVEFARWDLRHDNGLGQFDVVACMDVVCSIRRPLARRRALRLVAGSVRPGGALLVSAFIQDDFVERAVWARWLGLGARVNIEQFAAQRGVLPPGRRRETEEHLIALFETVPR